MPEVSSYAGGLDIIGQPAPEHDRYRVLAVRDRQSLQVGRWGDGPAVQVDVPDRGLLYPACPVTRGGIDAVVVVQLDGQLEQQVLVVSQPGEVALDVDQDGR